MTFRASPLVARILGPLALALALCLTVAGAINWSLVSSVHREQLRRDIITELHDIENRTSRLKVVAVVDAIEHRLMMDQVQDGGWFYLLVEKDDGTYVAGNHKAWPTTMTDDGEWVEFLASFNGHNTRILGKSHVVDGYYRLMVGRDLSTSKAFQLATAWINLLVLLSSFLIFLIFAYLHSRHISERFERITASVNSFRLGHRDDGPAMPGDDEISQLSRRISEMMETIDRQMEHLRKISNVVAHEFRSPLSRAVTLLDDTRARLERGEQADQSLDQAEDTLTDLLALSQQLLEIAENESSFGGDLETMDLNASLQDVRRLLFDVAADQKTRLDLDLGDDVEVLGNRQLITRLVANLVQNALEALGTGGTITCVTRQVNGRSEVRVCDSGAGVNAASFDEMVRTYTSPEWIAGKTGKHGLGLRLVKAIAVRHGASVSVQRTDNRFCIAVLFPQVRKAR